MTDAWGNLFKSRKFWLLLWDVVTGTILVIITQSGATFKADVLFLIGALQPVFLFAVGALAIQDATATSAGVVYAQTLSPIQALLQSRKFWLLIIDQVVSITLYFVGAYALNALDLVKAIIGIYQPMFVLLISGVTVENVASIKALGAGIGRDAPG